MSINIFDNNDWTAVTALAGGAVNTNGFMTWRSLPLDLIFQRELIGYALDAYWTDPATGLRTRCPYQGLEVQVQQPLNQTEEFALDLTVPAGGAFAAFPQGQTVKVPGPTNGVTFLPVPFKVGLILIFAADVASIGNTMIAELTLWWKAAKPVKFVGDK